MLVVVMVIDYEVINGGVKSEQNEPWLPCRPSHHGEPCLAQPWPPAPALAEAITAGPRFPGTNFKSPGSRPFGHRLVGV